MGLRCLIGHDYGEPRTTRDREERGGEVVVTIREFKECARCGDRQVISENKEVRANPDREQPEETPASVERATDSDEPGTEEYDDVSAEEDDGIILPDDAEEASEERQRGEWPETDAGDDESPIEGDHQAWPEAADRTDEVEADHGSWPEAADRANEVEGDHQAWPEDERETEPEESEHADWPEVEGEDEGFDAAPADDEDVEDVEFGGGLTPERARGSTELDAEGEVVSPDDAETSPDDGTTRGEGDDSPSGIRRADPGPSPTARQRSVGADAIFECPECGHTAPADGGSLRPGDICPECRRGYLAEREQ